MSLKALLSSLETIDEILFTTINIKYRNDLIVQRAGYSRRALHRRRSQSGSTDFKLTKLCSADRSNPDSGYRPERPLGSATNTGLDFYQPLACLLGVAFRRVR